MSAIDVNAFGEISCSICGLNEGMPGPNMKHICQDCRETMWDRTVKQFEEESKHEVAM